jgi:hypothetical protein
MESEIRSNFKFLYLRKTVPEHSDINHDTGKYEPTSCYIDQRWYLLIKHVASFFVCGLLQ